MKSVLLTFLFLGMVAVLKAQEVPLDDKEDFAGMWYPKAMIHSGNLSSHEVPTKMFPVKITALEGGDLEATVIFWKKGQCREFKIMMEKTDEPGKYSTFHGKKFIYIIELPVKDHYVFYCEGHHHGKSFGIGKLMGRNPQENLEAMEEFRKFIQHKGLQMENIFIPELNDKCVPESN